jgi:hypothetical protein
VCGLDLCTCQQRGRVLVFCIRTVLLNLHDDSLSSGPGSIPDEGF